MASEELEQLAAKNAMEAIQLDRQGSTGMAITKYQRAVEILLKLCSLYPNASHNVVYTQRASSYQKRISELQHGRGAEAVEATPSGGAKFEQTVLKEKPNVKWDDIADLEVCKKAIEESIIYPVKRPDLFEAVGWPRGILFFGPPGCGKTMLAAAVATEIEAAFYCVDAASIMSKWLGESEKNVASLFDEARRSSDNGQPAVIFLDEVDSLVGLRSQEVGGETRTRNQFLKEMDGVIDKSKRSYVYVIGATNKPWALDDPFIRRFQKRIYVPLPDERGRFELFRITTKNLNLTPDVDLKQLVTLTQGYTGSDITDLLQAVHLKVVREFFETHNLNDKQSCPRAICMQDYLDVMEKRKPSVSPEILHYYEKWYESFKAL